MRDSDNAYPIVIENSKLKEENAKLREALQETYNALDKIWYLAEGMIASREAAIIMESIDYHIDILKKIGITPERE